MQAGRRFCECRPKEFIPSTDAQHTIIAYTASDHFKARPLARDDCRLELQAWLASKQALAYILISLNFNPFQKEFPPPLGQSGLNPLTITAATPDEMSHTAYQIDASPVANAAKLNPCHMQLSSRSFARNNFFQLEDAAHAPFHIETPTLPFKQHALAFH